MVLRIELSATDLAADTHRTRTTKLTSQAVTELATLAKQCEVLCPTDPKTSGEDSRPNSGNKQ
jgi:hypothetical protein